MSSNDHSRRQVVAVIPARGASKGIPRKNVQELDGHPLIAWSIATALKVPAITDTVVSTEDDEIAAIARRYGAHVVPRPDELASDEAPTEPVMVHVVDAIGCADDATVVLLQATSPFRRSATVERVAALVSDGACVSALTVQAQHPFRWTADDEMRGSREYGRRARRQDLAPTYHETGSIYATAVGALRASGDRASGATQLVPVDAWETVEIDGLDELTLARSLAPHWPVDERPRAPDAATR